jgi:hypothetical protein
MTQRTNSAQSSPVISDERLRDILRRQLDRSINIDREFTRERLAEQSGVNVYTIDSIMSRDPAKQRRIKLEDAMSLMWALEDEAQHRAVNCFAGLLGFVARRADDPGAISPAQIVADGLADFSVIAAAAADGRIDHTETEPCRIAADHLIATVLPLSSAGRGA